MTSHITVTPFLWFDDNAESAIQRYLEVFDTTELLSEERAPDGRLFYATIRLQGQEIMLHNGGPMFTLSEAFSFMVSVKTQEEIDTISDALINGGGRQSECGWLVDAFGLSWQIAPTALFRLMADPERGGRVRDAMLQMKRISIQGLQEAYDGDA